MIPWSEAGAILLMASFATAWLSLVLQQIAFGFLWSGLRQRHSSLWERLGRPKFLVKHGIEPMLHTRRMARLGEFNALADEEVSRWVAVLTWTHRVSMVSLVVLVVAVIGLYA